jgi:hypothetical protein
MARFTEQDIGRLRHLAGTGFSGLSIARELQRTPLAIRAKCCALGISLRPPTSTNEVRFYIDTTIMADLRAAADDRGIPVTRLCRQLLTAIAWDKMYAAVLDVPVPKKKRLPVPRGDSQV